MSHHRLERRRFERCAGELGQALAARRIRPPMLGDRECPCLAEPDARLAKVRVGTIRAQPNRQRFDVPALEPPPSELTERPSDAGRAPIEGRGGAFIVALTIFGIPRPKPTVEVAFGARDDARDRSPRRRVREVQIGERFVAFGRM
jgi:hypothetical protein